MRVIVAGLSAPRVEVGAGISAERGSKTRAPRCECKEATAAIRGHRLLSSCPYARALRSLRADARLAMRTRSGRRLTRAAAALPATLVAGFWIAAAVAAATGAAAIAAIAPAGCSAASDGRALRLEHHRCASPRDRVEALVLPPAQASTHVLGIDVEHVADVVERKDPALVFMRDPFVGIAEQPLALAGGRVDAFHEAFDRVLEHAQDEPLFPLEQMLLAHRLEVLNGQKRVGLEQPRQSLVQCFLFLHLLSVIRLQCRAACFFHRPHLPVSFGRRPPLRLFRVVFVLFLIYFVPCHLDGFQFCFG